MDLKELSGMLQDRIVQHISMSDSKRKLKWLLAYTGLTMRQLDLFAFYVLASNTLDKGGDPSIDSARISLNYTANGIYIDTNALESRGLITKVKREAKITDKGKRLLLEAIADYNKISVNLSDGEEDTCHTISTE